MLKTHKVWILTENIKKIWFFFFKGTYNPSKRQTHKYPKCKGALSIYYKGYKSLSGNTKEELIHYRRNK